MNITEILIKYYICGKCKKQFLEENKQAAEECCKCRECKISDQSIYGLCKRCNLQREIEQLTKRITIYKRDLQKLSEIQQEMDKLNESI